MEITCPSCKGTGVVKAEVNVLPNMPGQEQFLESLRKMAAQTNTQEGTPILDSDILSLRETLKESTSAQDLFS